MDERELDRYETFSHVREDPLIPGKYVLYEKDSVKGTRMTVLDGKTGKIYKERRWKVGEEVTP